MFLKAKYYFQELNALSLDPIGLRRIRVPVQTRELTLVFYGDSRAAQWPQPVWLEGQVLNLGIQGQTTEQILERFDFHLKPLHPKIVLVQAGINDLKTIPLFPRDEEIIIANCCNNLRRIVERSRQLGAHVVISTIFPIGQLPPQRRPFWSDRVDPAIKQVNQFIGSLASNDVSVFDTAAVLADKNGKLIPKYSRDLLHLSAEGYKQLNIGLRGCLEPVISDWGNHGAPLRMVPQEKPNHG